MGGFFGAFFQQPTHDNILSEKIFGEQNSQVKATNHNLFHQAEKEMDMGHEM